MMDSVIICCIDGCERLGALRNKRGLFFCREHYIEELEQETCTTCTSCAPKCDVSGCTGDGVIEQHGTGKRYCIEHAWKGDRDHGLSHPASVLTDADKSFLSLLSISFDGDDRK